MIEQTLLEVVIELAVHPRWRCARMKIFDVIDDDHLALTRAAYARQAAIGDGVIAWATGLLARLAALIMIRAALFLGKYSVMEILLKLVLCQVSVVCILFRLVLETLVGHLRQFTFINRLITVFLAYHLQLLILERLLLEIQITWVPFIYAFQFPQIRHACLNADVLVGLCILGWIYVSEGAVDLAFGFVELDPYLLVERLARHFAIDLTFSWLVPASLELLLWNDGWLVVVESIQRWDYELFLIVLLRSLCLRPNLRLLLIWYLQLDLRLSRRLRLQGKPSLRRFLSLPFNLCPMRDLLNTCFQVGFMIICCSKPTRHVLVKLTLSVGRVWMLILRFFYLYWVVKILLQIWKVYLVVGFLVNRLLPMLLVQFVVRLVLFPLFFVEERRRGRALLQIMLLKVSKMLWKLQSQARTMQVESIVAKREFELGLIAQITSIILDGSVLRLFCMIKKEPHVFHFGWQSGESLDRAHLLRGTLLGSVIRLTEVPLRKQRVLAATLRIVKYVELTIRWHRKSYLIWVLGLLQITLHLEISGLLVPGRDIIIEPGEVVALVALHPLLHWHLRLAIWFVLVIVLRERRLRQLAVRAVLDRDLLIRIHIYFICHPSDDNRRLIPPIRSSLLQVLKVSEKVWLNVRDAGWVSVFLEALRVPNRGLLQYQLSILAHQVDSFLWKFLFLRNRCPDLGLWLLAGGAGGGKSTTVFETIFENHLSHFACQFEFALLWLGLFVFAVVRPELDVLVNLVEVGATHDEGAAVLVDIELLFILQQACSRQAAFCISLVAVASGATPWTLRMDQAVRRGVARQFWRCQAVVLLLGCHSSCCRHRSHCRRGSHDRRQLLHRGHIRREPRELRSRLRRRLYRRLEHQILLIRHSFRLQLICLSKMRLAIKLVAARVRLVWLESGVVLLGDVLQPVSRWVLAADGRRMLPSPGLNCCSILDFLVVFHQILTI